MDNVILDQVCQFVKSYTAKGLDKLKFPGIYGYNRTRVFSVGYGSKQSYSMEFDW